jgi:lipopolysaccharide/colanic/teichoic acid biosynthesis glycosyltransferase
VVTTDATGAADAIMDGITGIRVVIGNVDDLTTALGRLLSDPELRSRMGASGRAWVQRTFQREIVWKDLLADYREVLQHELRCRQHGWSRLVKLGFDRVGAAIILLVSAPFWLATAAITRWSFGAPVLFKQVRPGLKGRPFTLYKFRTMRNTNDVNGVLLPDAERLTPIGRLIRSTSLDELPQLWNVLRGDMSLVGPRPLLTEYMDRYDAEQARRHDVMPGITGWAQINGRNALSWDEKFDLDIWYVDNWSLHLDLRILWLTLLKVLRQDGINQSRHLSMPEFTGSSPNCIPPGLIERPGSQALPDSALSEAESLRMVSQRE